MKPEESEQGHRGRPIKAATEPLQKKIEELEKQPVPAGTGSGARFALIDRDGKVIEKATASDARNPMAVS